MKALKTDYRDGSSTQEGPHFNPQPNSLPDPCNRSSTFNGEIGVYGIDIAPLSIFENQGTKFIPK